MLSSAAHFVTSRTNANSASMRARNFFLISFQSTGSPAALRRLYSVKAQFHAKRATPAARIKAAACSGVGFRRILCAFCMAFQRLLEALPVVRQPAKSGREAMGDRH